MQSNAGGQSQCESQVSGISISPAAVPPPLPVTFSRSGPGSRSGPDAVVPPVLGARVPSIDPSTPEPSSSDGIVTSIHPRDRDRIAATTQRTGGAYQN